MERIASWNNELQKLKLPKKYFDRNETVQATIMNKTNLVRNLMNQ